MKITRHAQQRMEERLNVKGAKAQRKHIEKVMLKGATAINSEIPKPLVGMIKRKSSHYLDKSVYFRIYNKSVYLFSKRTKALITVLTIDCTELKRMCGEIRKRSKWR